jgi:hypothetical protein
LRLVAADETCSSTWARTLSAAISSWPIPAKTARSTTAGASLMRSVTCGMGIMISLRAYLGVPSPLRQAWSP